MQGHGSGRRRAAFRFRAAGFVLLVAHLSYVGWLTLRPLTAPWVTAVSLEPLATIRADLALGPWEATRSIGGALLLLAPLGVLLPLAGGRVTVYPLASFVRTVFAGAMLSLTIALVHSELTGQIMNVDTVLLNTAGVALAHLAVVPPVRAWLRRRADRKQAAHPRRQGREGEREEGVQAVASTIAGVGIAP